MNEWQNWIEQNAIATMYNGIRDCNFKFKDFFVYKIIYVVTARKCVARQNLECEHTAQDLQLDVVVVIVCDYKM